VTAVTSRAVGPLQLGATYDAAGESITFRVRSQPASRLDVWIYAQPVGAAEKLSFPMTRDPATNIWTKTVTVAEVRAAGVEGTVYYGYRAWGPNWAFDPAWRKGTLVGRTSDVDEHGHRFNPNKLLLDPYALEVSHDPKTPQHADDSLFFTGSHAAADTGERAPKGIVLKVEAAVTGPKPTRPFRDEIIYEVHLRGLTKNDPSIPEPERGTYAGAARKAAYLKSLGVTAIEFLPLQEFQNEHNDLNPASTHGDNYWGYDPYNYFAPDRRYAADKSPGGPTREIRAMTKAFHEQGLKVYLDVVYNHTGEQSVSADGKAAKSLSFRGLDNPSYYELSANPHYYHDSNGVGPNLNAANAVVRDLTIDSLTYWKDVLGFDGFRFDLASILANTCERGCFNFNKFTPEGILNRAVNELPVRPEAGGPGVDLIAEPWALELGTYQLGEFPIGWAEWNDKYRDTIRTAQNRLGVAHIPPAELARRLAGSSDKFQDDGRKPWHSVNFIVAHDGFSLRDLYSYNDRKNNQSWPFGPSDGGASNNLSWDQGGDPRLQRQAARTGLALLMVSAGVPMITGGDEMYRTQFGNNNAYNLDSEKNHLDYSDATQNAPFFNFSQKLFAFRHAHSVLRPSSFFRGSDRNGNSLKDITWLTNTGAEPDSAYFNHPENHFLAFRLDGSEAGDSAASLYIAYNGWREMVTATLPPNLPGKRWFRVADTAAWMEDRDNFNAPDTVELMNGASYGVNARSVLILIEK
jgi:isoamylase